MAERKILGYKCSIVKRYSIEQLDEGNDNLSPNELKYEASLKFIEAGNWDPIVEPIYDPDELVA